jgi:outer membrane murein-binding lipoprotein Lpp
MERNRWETAIRCLEVAVHPNTNDEEIVAAVNGFRRTADGVPLGQLCREFAGTVPGPAAAGNQDRLDRLSGENRELRQKIEALEAEWAAAAARLQAAERRASDGDEKLRAAEARAGLAEQRLAEFQAMYGRISVGLQHENLGLRRALDEAHRHPAAPAARPPAAPFQLMLSAARQRLDPAPTPRPASTRPWTA